jgi:lipoprotein LpqH
VSVPLLVVGCASAPDKASPAPGTLISGTAQITVNDADLGEFTSVHCTIAGPLTTITTGNDETGSTTTISNEEGLTAKAVSIRNLGGFTGSYNEGLGGEADVELDGNTYTITGTADGFATDKPSFRTTGTFSIKVAC